MFINCHLHSQGWNFGFLKLLRKVCYTLLLISSVESWSSRAVLPLKLELIIGFEEVVFEERDHELTILTSSQLR
jgi:hypothetical protein